MLARTSSPTPPFIIEEMRECPLNNASALQAVIAQLNAPTVAGWTGNAMVGWTLPLLSWFLGLMLLSAALAAWVGPQGAMTAAVISASVELHAAVATLGTLQVRADIDMAQAEWLMLALLAASLGAKSVIAWLSGGSSCATLRALILNGTDSGEEPCLDH